MLRSLIPIAVMGCVLLACAWLVGGATGAVLALGAVLVLSVAGPSLPSHAAMRLYGAIPLHPAQVPGLYRELAHLADRAALPVTPRLYRLRTATPAAFTVGSRADPAIAVSDGMLYLLGGRERTGVLAHEVAHIASGDVTLMRLSDLLRRFTAFLCNAGLIALLLLALLVPGTIVPIGAVLLLAAAPFGLGLLQLAVSRGREFAADAAAARLTGDPQALASALHKLEQVNRWSLQRVLGQLSGFEVPSCLRTHPETGERIARLVQIGRSLPRNAAAQQVRRPHYLMRFDPSGNPF